MLEFTPFDPFNHHVSQQQECLSQESDSFIKKDSDIITDQSLNLNSFQEKQEKVSQMKFTSEQHNMIKHIINIMKKMIGKHIGEVGTIYTKPIIQKVWKQFMRCKNPTRKILKAMFDRKTSKKLIEQGGFASILNQYGLQEYLKAMEELREEVVFRMSGSNLINHLMEKEIQRKERLAAYAQYLVKYEIKKGEILNRTTEDSKLKIQSILNTNRKYSDIDNYLY